MKTIAILCTLLLTVSALTAENYRSSSSSVIKHREASAAVTIKVTDHPKLGKILTDQDGMTLYIFTPDVNKQSTCYDHCAIAWPPLTSTTGRAILASGVIGRLDTIPRKDNTKQITYNDMPLYYFEKDKKPGDVLGQNLENKWFVVQPKATQN